VSASHLDYCNTAHNTITASSARIVTSRLACIVRYEFVYHAYSCQYQTKPKYAEFGTGKSIHGTQIHIILCTAHVQCESKKSPPPCGLRFSDVFDKGFGILNQFFTHLLHVPIYAILQIFIQLSEILTKLCHIKRDYLVHVICLKCPPSAETHAFRRSRKSLIALLIVICGKSSQICCYYNVNIHVGYDMTPTVTSFAQ